jgi:hypothetical protein
MVEGEVDQLRKVRPCLPTWRRGDCLEAAWLALPVWAAPGMGQGPQSGEHRSAAGAERELEQISWRPVAGWGLMPFVCCFTQLIIAACYCTVRMRHGTVQALRRFEESSPDLGSPRSGPFSFIHPGESTGASGGERMARHAAKGAGASIG